MIGERLRFWDPLLLVPVAVLLLAGGVMVFSATVLPPGGGYGLIQRHGISVVLGVAIGFLMARVPLRFHDDEWALVYFVVAIALLGLVLLLGETHHGARRWLQWGPVRFQPSEPAKLAFVFCLGRFLAGKRCDLRRFQSLVSVLSIILLPFLLVLLQPDLGTALSFLAAGLGMLVWAGLPWIALFAFVSPGVFAALSTTSFVFWVPVLLASVALLRRHGIAWALIGLYAVVQIGLATQADELWNRLPPYQRARLETFWSPEDEPQGAGYQVIQSKIAIGSGGLGGKGIGDGSQKQLAFLPRQHTDFIYSVVGEEIGFWGGMIVLGAFALLIVRGLTVARRARSRFASVVAVGMVSLIFYHASVNIAMTLGLAPVTGLPLPFLSFGGSFMVTALASAGVLVGVSARRHEY